MPIVAHSFKTPTPADALAGHDGTSNWSPRMFALADVLNLATQQITTQIAQATIGITQTTADNTGATDATAQLRADYATARATGHRRLYLPAGTYRIVLTSGILFQIGTAFTHDSDNVEIFGDGMGKTILSFDAVALVGNVNAVRTFAKHTYIHDMTIQFAAGTTGDDYYQVGVNCDSGCYYPVFRRVEVINPFGGENISPGGVGFGLYGVWNGVEYPATTLGTAIAAGARTVTPGSMAGMYVGRRLYIGGTAEQVIVTAITATTFTATFANAHTASDSVTIYSRNSIWGLVEECIVRDAPRACGFVVNASDVTFRKCISIGCGDRGSRHGFYDQGGNTLIENCYVEGAGGYSYHGYKSANDIDASGSVYRNNISVNPGQCHLLVQAATVGTGHMPDLLVGDPSARFTVIDGNQFRCLLGAGTAITDGINVSVPAIISNNVFEDASNNAVGAWCNASGGGIVIQGNIFRTYLATHIAPCIYVAGNSTVIANRIVNHAAKCIDVRGANTTVADNYIEFKGAAAGDIGIGVGNLDSITIRNNTIVVAATNGQAIRVDTATNILIESNIVNGSGAAFALYSNGPTLTGTIRGNRLGTSMLSALSVTPSPDLLVADNQALSLHNAALLAAPNTKAAITPAMGRLLGWPKGANVLTAGRLVKLDASGDLAVLGTSDTVFVGVALFDTSNAAGSVFIAGDTGKEATISTDGAWTAGHVGVASTTSAGAIHDSGGTTAPASGSYVVFLDSGAAGSARCMLVKTL